MLNAYCIFCPPYFVNYERYNDTLDSVMELSVQGIFGDGRKIKKVLKALDFQDFFTKKDISRIQ